ncbi:MAG: polyprenyl synthetase family protein [Thermoguttaceae bacterium]
MNDQAVLGDSASSFTALARSLGPQVDAALDARTSLGEGCPVRLREAMRHSLLAPGKRIRPLLALFATQACGGQMEAAMPAACAVEMVHAYSLIHDDLPALDNDDLRRGRPTCHKAFDEATAILAGDALLTLAFEVLSREIQPPAAAAACCAALAQAAGACNMVGGQIDDLESEGGRWKAEGGSPKSEFRNSNSDFGLRASSLARLESIHARKTGAMIRVSLRLGGIVAGATDEQLAALNAYGEHVGLVFQITDDLLDVRSTAAAMGKRVGKDAEQGKLTFPGFLGVDESVRRAQELTAAAVEALGLFGDAADPLRALARYVLERNR